MTPAAAFFLTVFFAAWAFFTTFFATLFSALTTFFATFFSAFTTLSTAFFTAFFESKLCRWGGNLRIVMLNTLIAPLFFMGGVAAAAVAAQERGWGLLNLVDLPFWLECGLAVVALDLIIYGQHQVFHAFPILWRFHMMHHSDLDLDVTSGVRFHPVEIVISLVVKRVAVIALGIPMQWLAENVLHVSYDGWPLSIVFVVTGVLAWICGRAWNGTRKDGGPSPHTLFFVPLQLWGPLLAIGAVANLVRVLVG